MIAEKITAERQEYNRNGFCIIRNVFDQEQIRGVVAEIRSIFCDQLRLLGTDADAEGLSCELAMKRLFDADLKKYLAAMSVLARLAGVARLLHSEKLWTALQKFGYRRAVISSHPVTHVMSPDLKIPDGYYGVEAHQDWTSLQGSLDTVVVWVPLVDIDAGLNPLELIPGSHRQGLLKAIPSQNESVVDPGAYNDADFIPLEIRSGDAAFMSCFTIHRSGKIGRTGEVRLACSTRYENLAESTFAVRGYPTAYKRSVHRDLYFQNFPSREQVARIFGLNEADRDVSDR